MLISYHNDPKLKESIVSEMCKHQKQDQFIKGTYAKMNGKFKGCAVGCAIDSFNIKLGKSYDKNNHKAFEEAIGVPEYLARVQDTIFEGLPEKENSKFAVDFLAAIPVGVNLYPVKWKFCAFILKENIERTLTLKYISDELKEKVVNSIRQCLKLHEDAIETGKWDESAAVSAASAARSAAWSVESAASAARSAAWSVESAARSAASAAWSVERAARSAASAARSAKYQRYAKELLRILEQTV